MTPPRPLPSPTDPTTLPWVPNQTLREKLVEKGMPAKDATDAVLDSSLRFFATSFYFDTLAADRGDKAAKERVDYCRHIWNEQRKLREAS